VLTASLTAEVDIKTHFQLNLYNKQNTYEGWNFNSGNYLFTTDTK